MKSWIGNLSLILLFFLLAGGCTIHHESRLYDLETGNVIVFKSSIRGNRATSEGILPNGSRCRGEAVSGGAGFVTSGGSYSSGSWGGIYGYANTSFSAVTVPMSQRGVSFAICDDGTAIDCEYRVSAPNFQIQGYGMCRDNKGKYYRLIF